jgi:hypothetical protein
MYNAFCRILLYFFRKCTIYFNNYLFYSTQTCFDVYTSTSMVSNKVTKLIKWERLYKLLLKIITGLKSLKTS